MANRVLQQKMLKEKKRRRKMPKALRASNWSRRVYPAKEVIAEYQERARDLARPLGFFDLMFQHASRMDPKSIERKRAKDAKEEAILQGKRMVELISEPDFIGRIQQFNRIVLIQGAQHTLCLHFKGLEWIFVEETLHYIRYSVVYGSKKEALYYERIDAIDWENGGLKHKNTS